MNKILLILPILFFAFCKTIYAQEVYVSSKYLKYFEIEGTFEVVKIVEIEHLYSIYIESDNINYIVLSRAACSQNGFSNIKIGYTYYFKLRSLFFTSDSFYIAPPSLNHYISGQIYDGMWVKMDDSTGAYRDLFISENLQGLSYIPSNVECECKVPEARVRLNFDPSVIGSEGNFIIERD